MKLDLEKREFIINEIENGRSLRHFCGLANNDYEVVMAAVLKDGMELEYASEEMQKKKSIVLAAVGQNGLALQFADKKMQNDEEVASTAMASNIEAIEFVGKVIQTRISTIAYAIANGCDPRSKGIKYIPSEKIYEEVAKIKENKGKVKPQTTKNKIITYKVSKELIEKYFYEQSISKDTFDKQCDISRTKGRK